MVPYEYYVALSGLLMVLGLIGVIVRRNIIAMLISTELMLNAVNIAFVAFDMKLHDVAGQVFVFFILTIAAAEAAVGLGLIMAIYRMKKDVDVEKISELRG
ncbi:NADH-quinone oxidoreductase subunit NuoK [Venenivibrio stagnispumantis]|uniref:NADH-quinone oxidoreductase subunit K n=1 Tax=Venenivibrio stagnispumantis TaxID=407998 RepID=A0AA46AD01_9AQUI|nr:NADH-quinone oxidoreductase subunit NuoK [Venenivibrio stagnispumantis]MCW4572524.1 NADH-quinone oxidoreductase subunit NuoK [Venenivibrio stagnispumantis]SMP01809.1 NADH-quinone oxidoreductase subunit K [Venenivibrio stagnispumantis]